MHVRTLWICLFMAGCAGRRPSPLAFQIPTGVADTVVSEQLAPGVLRHHLVRNAGPLRVDVLDIDLTACITMRAVKGAPTAVGRQTTSALLGSLDAADSAVAAINADFFTFTPPGVPTGALIENGRIIAGPIARPVLSFDASNRPYIGALSLTARIVGRRDSLIAQHLNRPQRTGTGLIDAAWGQPLDTLLRLNARLLVPLAPRSTSARLRYRVTALPTGHGGVLTGDTLLLFGNGAEHFDDGDSITVTRRFEPVTSVNAVGGFPLLLLDSAVVASIDTDGAVGFRGLNPRTAAGIGLRGRRLLLVVIDGRRPGFSVGTTTRETADLMRELGAVDAINLDGGGSTAMVARDAASGARRLLNRPSDAEGERPVGDALVVTRRCARAGAP
jgi:hypothetical protein